jgi:GH24 family phage-related lysozyme (muramidase)
MKPQMKSSPAARELIKRFEPFRPVAEPGPDGRMLVGYGHRAAAKPGVKVSEDEAALLLIYDVMQSEKAIDEVASEPLSRRQRDALVAFVHGVGVAAFKTSDVARYLYEGRAQAAGEAIAAYGDGQGERREAESTHFLAGEPAAPAAPRKKAEPPTVELLIKIEHPEDEAEGAELAAAEMAASHPDEEPAAEIAPPLAPPPSIESLAETPADDALAGEAVGVESVELPPAPLPPEPLAAVADGALPEPENEPDVEAKAESKDEPTGEAEIESASADTEAEPAPAEPKPMTVHRRSAVFGAGFSGGPLPFSPAIRIADPKDAAALKDKPETPAAEAASQADEATAEAIIEQDETAADPAIESEAPEAETIEAEAPVDETPAEEAAEEAAPEIDAQDVQDVAADMPADTPVEDVVEDAPEAAAPADDPAALVIARMERQIDGMQAEIEGVDRGYARAESGEDETRIEGRVGYVFAGEMHARLPAEDETPLAAPPEAEIEIADQPEAEAEPLTADDVEDDAPTPEFEAEAEVEPVVEPEEADAEDEPSTETPAAEDEALQLDPVLIAPAHAEPPHPAEAPAFANGAVGEAGSGQVFEIEEAEDEPFADQRDELAPEDLGGDIDPYSSEDLKSEQGDELIGFSIAFGIGLIVVAFGGLETWSRLDYYMSEGSIFPGPGAIAGGLFLTIGAGYFTVTELLHKLRRR